MQQSFEARGTFFLFVMLNQKMRTNFVFSLRLRFHMKVSDFALWYVIAIAISKTVSNFHECIILTDIRVCKIH